jgi:hypothetical protein
MQRTLGAATGIKKAATYRCRQASRGVSYHGGEDGKRPPAIEIGPRRGNRRLSGAIWTRLDGRRHLLDLWKRARGRVWLLHHSDASCFSRATWPKLPAAEAKDGAWSKGVRSHFSRLNAMLVCIHCSSRRSQRQQHLSLSLRLICNTLNLPSLLSECNQAGNDRQATNYFLAFIPASCYSPLRRRARLGV